MGIGILDTVNEAAVRAVMTALIEGRVEDFRAVDPEMGLTVAVVGKESDRYCVRRKPIGAAEPEEGSDESHRDEWRSQRWIEAMLAQGHWVPD